MLAGERRRIWRRWRFILQLSLRKLGYVFQYHSHNKLRHNAIIFPWCNAKAFSVTFQNNDRKFCVRSQTYFVALIIWCVRVNLLYCRVKKYHYIVYSKAWFNFIGIAPLEKVPFYSFEMISRHMRLLVCQVNVTNINKKLRHIHWKVISS